MEILLDTHNRSWYVGNNVYSIGYAFIGEQLMKEETLCLYLSEQIKHGDLSKSLEELNGSFAAIIQNGNEYYLIVDQIRSYPLLYVCDGKNCCISDNASFLEKYYENTDFKDVVIAEFLAMGYLYGDKTLYENIKSVEAGSYVLLSNNKIYEKCVYYRHIFPKIQGKTDQELINISSIKLEKAFCRILRTIGERQIVIPLSGGYDSRLIACLCKKYNVSDIICFTYGVPESDEVRISKQVAENLGFMWYFVEYTQDLWIDLCCSEFYTEYQKFAGNLNTVPCIQDFIAIKELVKRKLISDNAVVLPGHSADLLGGSHLVFNNNLSLDRLLYEKYCNLNVLKWTYQKKIQRKIKQSIKIRCRDMEEYWNLFNDWGIKVRQSHFIVNSVRIYEFFGLEWRLLFWDTEFSEFWNSIEWEKKKGSYLYHTFLMEKYFKDFSVDFLKIQSSSSSFCSQVKRIFPLQFFLIIRYIKNMLRERNVEKDENLFYVVVNYYRGKNEWALNYLLNTPSNINAVLALEYCNLVKLY